MLNVEKTEFMSRLTSSVVPLQSQSPNKHGGKDDHDDDKTAAISTVKGAPKP